MGAAALIMAFSVLLSRFMGLFRDKIISWQFGAGGEADIYFAAFVVPDFLNYLLAGGYVSITLIPLLSRRFEENEEDAWRFFGTVFCWATLAIGLLTAFAWIAAPVLAPLVAPGFDAAQCARLTEFLRIVLPAQVFFLPGAWLLGMGIKNKRRKTVLRVRIIAICSLALTVIVFCANVIAVSADASVGRTLYDILNLVSAPMFCIQYWIISIFLWACLFSASFKK